MAEFCMPSLGADMDYGTLVEWTVKPGDPIRRGDIIALVDTEKGLIEIEVWEDGVVESLVAAPGEKLAVGAVMAMIGPSAEAAAKRPEAAPKRAPAPRPAPSPPPAEVRPRPSAQAPKPTAAAPAAGRTPVSPLARRRAADLGLDLSAVRPGDGGVIRVADVERAGAARRERPPTIEAPPAAPAAAAEGPPREVAAAEQRAAAMRRVIAAAMARSKREIPHYYLECHVDVERALSWLAEENRKRPVTERVLATALLLKAVALAVREVPEMNGYFVDGALRASELVHVGVAIALRQGGLVAPALHDVDRKPLVQVMKEMLDLTKRVRGGIIRSSEIADATITVTSLGDQGVESVFGVIYPPQVALVGFGKIVERPWAVGGMVGVRRVVSASLAADHRASDGHRGGRFLAAVDRLLQEPEKL
jgi:pyruvate dehydrogenase E2 component (dihydrolipoamide acetyltransferase)